MGFRGGGGGGWQRALGAQPGGTNERACENSQMHVSHAHFVRVGSPVKRTLYMYIAVCCSENK